MVGSLVAMGVFALSSYVNLNLALQDAEPFAITHTEHIEAKEIEVATSDSSVKSQDNTEGVVRSYFKDVPIMAKIAWCESKFKHTGSGGVILRGMINPSDIGVMQINEQYHSKTAQILGINLYTLDGNLKYARYLYEREGTRPWASSQKCWEGNSLARN